MVQRKSANPPAQKPEFHLLLNGLSMGGGGGYTVGLQLFLNIARLRPQWKVTMAVIAGHPLHQEIVNETLEPNCQVHWAPATARGQLARSRYESGEFTRWMKSQQVDFILQLNGMIIPGVSIPTLAHCQDPWPYRPEAWNRPQDRVIAFFKRRANRLAFRQAAIVGWTSHYLRDLMCARLGLTPQHGAVFYNGVATEWLDRAAAPLPSWTHRPLEITTVGNVAIYKQQDMVIRALADLRKQPGLEKLIYRIAGECPADLARHLAGLAHSLGIGDAVIMEGRVSRERIAAIFGQARCFVLMSKCESFGLPAVEAMTFGTPAVVADCCALPEVCGTAASKVSATDLPGLVRAITDVLQNPAAAENMRQLGAENVLRFGWSATAQAMIDSMEACLARRANPGPD